MVQESVVGKMTLRRMTRVARRARAVSCQRGRLDDSLATIIAGKGIPVPTRRECGNRRETVRMQQAVGRAVSALDCFPESMQESAVD